MTPIRKTVVKITILHEDDEPVSGMDLKDVLYNLTEGGWIGRSAIASSELVPEEKLRDEQIALGGDGTFFDYRTED